MAKRIRKDPFYEMYRNTKNEKTCAVAVGNEDKYLGCPDVHGYMPSNYETCRSVADNEDLKDDTKKDEHLDESGKNDVVPIKYTYNRSEDKKMNRKCRKQHHLQAKFEELKLLVENPSTVQIEDVSAPNPLLLNKYKNTHNCVPVPPYWKYKKTIFYVQEAFNPPFVPEGYFKQREEFYESIDKKTRKDAENEIKYPKLKPQYMIPASSMQGMYKCAFDTSRLLKAGVLYDAYEGIKVKKKINMLDNMSSTLKKACGMTKYTPPQWLLNMQKIGPPPNTMYKIPGVNCSIPKNCVYGYEENGWDELPLDADGKQKYIFEGDSSFSDVFFSDETANEPSEQSTECEIRTDGRVGHADGDVKRRRVDKTNKP